MPVALASGLDITFVFMKTQPHSVVSGNSLEIKICSFYVLRLWRPTGYHQLDPTRVISFVTRDCEKQITNKKYSSVSGFMGLLTRVCIAAGGSTSYRSISIAWLFHQSLCMSGSPRSLPHPHTSGAHSLYSLTQKENHNSQLCSLGAFRHNVPQCEKIKNLFLSSFKCQTKIKTKISPLQLLAHRAQNIPPTWTTFASTSGKIPRWLRSVPAILGVKYSSPECNVFSWLVPNSSCAFSPLSFLLLCTSLNPSLLYLLSWSLPDSVFFYFS